MSKTNRTDYEYAHENYRYSGIAKQCLSTLMRQEALAQVTGIPKDRINQFIEATVIPTADELMLISTAFGGMPMEKLFDHRWINSRAAFKSAKKDLNGMEKAFSKILADTVYDALHSFDDETFEYAVNKLSGYSVCEPLFVPYSMSSRAKDKNYFTGLFDVLLHSVDKEKLSVAVCIDERDFDRMLDGLHLRLLFMEMSGKTTECDVRVMAYDAKAKIFTKEVVVFHGSERSLFSLSEKDEVLKNVADRANELWEKKIKVLEVWDVFPEDYEDNDSTW